jgi:hypothetical protein
MSVSSLECIKIILINFPAFKEHWLAYLDDWRDPSDDDRPGKVLELTDFAQRANGLPGIVSDLSEFANYVTALIEQGDVNILYLYEIFVFIEFLMLNGDEDVKTATATGFLEAMLNVTPEKIKASTYVPYLGKESIAYCKAWDRFTGVKTEGLWD